MHIVYSDDYDFHLPLIENVHPFDGRKYSRAYGRLREQFGGGIEKVTHTPAHAVADEDLLLVHSGAYLESLQSAAVLSDALEIAMLRLLPASVREQRLIQPMRLAAQGTIDAADLAMSSGGLVFHLGGGFHHAFRDRGEGFCIYADAAVAIRVLRKRQRLLDTDRVLVIDLDAHRGNGCEDVFASDPTVRFLDIYNFQIYPGPLDADETQAPYLIPIKAQTSTETYLQTLNDALPKFLAENDGAKLAIYNAGTDILAGDPLGKLAVSEAGVLERDRIVLDALAQRNIPAVVLTSGGYTSRSHVLIAQSVANALGAQLPVLRA